MKVKYLFAIMFIGLVLNIHAQTYEFNVSNGSYTELTESISLNNGMTWDDLHYTIPIGFDFQYFDTTVNQIFLDERFLNAILIFNKTEITPLLSPYGASIIDRGYDFNVGVSSGSLSNVSYKLEGTIGNRIFKIEWKNVGFYFDISDNGTSTDFTNFQLWLYEGSNNIEMHYGPNLITQPELVFEDSPGTMITLFPSYNVVSGTLVRNGYMLGGDPSSPQFQLITDAFFLTELSGIIPNGTIYRFSYTTTGIADSGDKFDGIAVYPNPALDYVNILFNKESRIIEDLRILDLYGRIVKSIDVPDIFIDLSDLSTGIYTIQFITKSGVTINRKLVKV